MKSFLTFAEALKGKQHKIDVDKDGKIEGEDLAKLRAMKKEEVEQIDEVEELDEDKYDRMLSSMLKGKSGERLLKKHSDEVKKTKDIESGKTLNKLVKKNPGVLKTHSAAVKRDKKIYGEEVEELDEISLQTMRSARDKLKSRAFDAHMDDNKYAAQHYAGRAVNMARKIRQKEHQVTKEEVDPTHKKILNKAKTSVPKAPKSEYERKVVSYLKKKYSEEVELEEVETTNESSAYGRISSRFKTFSGRSLDAAAKEHGDEAKKLQKEIEAQQKEIDRRKAAMKEEVKPMKPPFNAPYKKAAGDVKDKSGAVHTAASRAKHLAKTGMKTQTPVKEGVFGALAGGVLGGLAGGPLGAAAGAYLGHKAQQAGNNAKEVNKKLKKEEVEQIDELSFNTLASYASKVDQKDKQPLSKKRQAGYNSAVERMSKAAQTADLKKWGKISDSVEYNFDNEGNLMPNPVSFKQFLGQLDEIKMADLPSRKVSGRGYGTEYYKKEAEKDKSGYDDEKKEKSEVKRGRGRPVGSTSGARQKGSTTGKKRSGVEMTGYPLHLPNKN